jgi:hypothetical protein
MSQQPDNPGQRSAVSGERRVVTALFCNIVGSTTIAEQLDPEDRAEIVGGAVEAWYPSRTVSSPDVGSVDRRVAVRVTLAASAHRLGNHGTNRGRVAGGSLVEAGSANDQAASPRSVSDKGRSPICGGSDRPVEFQCLRTILLDRDQRHAREDQSWHESHTSRRRRPTTRSSRRPSGG